MCFEANNLTKSFQGRTVVGGLTFRGKIIVLIVGITWICSIISKDVSMGIKTV